MEQQSSLDFFLPSNGDLRLSHVHKRRTKMFEFQQVRKYIVLKVHHKLDVVIPGLSNILENCTCYKKQTAHKTHCLAHLIPAYLELTNVRVICVYVVTCIELTTLHFPNKFEEGHITSRKLVQSNFHGTRCRHWISENGQFARGLGLMVH
jgi:hypothetical protein